MITAAEYLELVKKPRRRSKYGARRTVYSGQTYASASEAARAAELDMLVLAGEAVWWKAQPKFELGVPENVYVADFIVKDRDGQVRAEDVKGMRTPKFNRDVKLWRKYGPYPLHVIGKGKTEIIVPDSMKRAA